MTILVIKNNEKRTMEVTITNEGYLKSTYGIYLVNQFLLQRAGMTKDEATTILQRGETATLNHPILSKCLCHLGENEGGLIIENYEEAKRREEQERQQLIAAGKEDVEVGFGFFGIIIKNRLDKAMWNVIRPYATFVEGNDSDLEWLDDQGFWNVEKKDVQGWYYSDEAIEALNNIGVKTTYLGIPVKTAKEMRAEREKRKEEEKKKYEKIRAEKQKQNALIDEFNSLERIYCSEEDVEKASHLEEILIPELGFEGENIYGGGKWLMQDDNYIYIAYNNGADGDDWSQNNFPTGGAGAILYKITKNYDSLGVFEKMMAYIPKKEEKDPVQECLDFFMKNDILPKEVDVTTCMGSFRGKALYVEIKDNFYLGITPEKDKIIYLVSRRVFFDYDLSSFEGNHYSALSFPFNESVYQTWLATLPEWARMAWNKESIQQGRFFVDSFVLPDNNYALYDCYRFNFAITSVDYSRGAEIVSFEPKTDRISVWSDGRILKNNLVSFNISDRKYNHEDVQWLLPFVWDYHKNAKPLSAISKKLIKADCYGFDKSILLRAVSHSVADVIAENKNMSVCKVDIGFEEGETSTFYEVYGAFASLDDVTEIYELHSDKDTALKSYNHFK